MDESSRITVLEMKVAELQRKLDFVMRHVGVPYAEPAPPPGMAEAVAFLKQGNKIEAINVYRSITGAGLREAKMAIEELAARLQGPVDG